MTTRTSTASRNRNTTQLGPPASAIEGAWREALAPFGIRVNANGSAVGPTASGIVQRHDVSVLSIGSARHTQGERTQYSVRFNAPHAPVFSLTKRTGTKGSSVPTGNPRFDALVHVITDEPLAYSRFLTEARLSLIGRMLARWTTMSVSNTEVKVTTSGIANAPSEMAGTVKACLALAEVMSQPVVGEVRMDEAYVLSSLFNSNLDRGEIAEHFDLLFRDREVTWAGEVLQVGAVDKAGQRLSLIHI